MSRLSNSIQLAQLLSQHEKMTAGELAQKLELNKKSVYRIIDDLETNGFLIQRDRGPSGGFRVASHEFFAPLTNEEIALLLMSIDVLASAEENPFKTQLQSARAKIEKAVLGKVDADKVDNWNQSIHYYRDAFTLPNLSNITLRIVSEAIFKRHVLNIDYYAMSSHSACQRKVNPYKLVFRNGFWYLIAFCQQRQDVRTFRVDRIHAIKELKSKFTFPKDFSLQEFLGSSWGIEKGEPMDVQVYFSPSIASFIQEVQWHPTQRIEVCDDGGLLFTASIEGYNEFRRWILGFGSQAKVISPQKLQDDLRQETVQLLKNYQ